MIFAALTNGKVDSTGTVTMNSYIFGGALISADGTNAATVIVRENDASGAIVFEIVTKAPLEIMRPIKCRSKTLYYSISGTGAAAQLYEWVN